MATVAVTNAIALGFPAGTTVKAYPQKGFPVVMPVTGAPSGTEAGSAAVAAAGTLSITGLNEQTYYVLAAEVSSVWHYAVVYIEAAGEITVIATQATGDFAITTAGKGLKIKEGSNAKMGTATLNGTTNVVVANTSVTSESKIFLSPKAIANAGFVNVVSKVAATSFTIVSSNAADVREVDYVIFEPA